MDLIKATYLAHRIKAVLTPFCERVEVAGSVRRRKPEVKDIEIVLIPGTLCKAVPPKPLSLGGLFDAVDDPSEVSFQTEYLNRVYEEWANSERAAFILEWIKPGVAERVPWQVKPDGKYWRAALKSSWMEYLFQEPCPEPLNLDIFLVTHATWGCQYLIRTGAAEFSRAVVTHAINTGRPCKDGNLHAGTDGPVIPTYQEEDVFRVLGLQWVRPQDRTSADAVRRGNLGTVEKIERPIRTLFE